MPRTPTLLRIIVPAFAADLTNIPFNDAAGKKTSLHDCNDKVVLLVSA